MRQLVLLICFSLPAIIFAQSNDLKSTEKNSQEVKMIKQLVKNCFSKDSTTREFAANRLLDFPADLFPKKSLKRIKKAVQDDELINFQLMLLTGYLQLEDQKARLMEFITIDSSAEYGFNESFSIDSKEWAAHLAMARMEGEEYVLHTDFVIVRMFYQELFHQELKSSYLMLIEQVAFVLKESDEWALIDLLEKNEKYYLTPPSEPAEKAQIIDLRTFVIDLIADGMNVNPPLDIRNFNNPEQSIEWFYELFYHIFESQDGVFRCRPRITYPLIYSRLKINIDTTRLLREGMTYFNKLPDPIDAIRLLEENSIRTLNFNDSIYLRTAMLLGKVYLKTKQPEKAMKIFDVLLNLEMPNNRPYIDKTGICRMLSDSLLAIRQFDKAIHYIRLLENTYPQVHGCGNGQSDFDSSIRARKLRYYVGKEMVDSVLLFSYYYVARPYEQSFYLPLSVEEIIHVVKTKYSQETLKNIVNNVSVFTKRHDYPNLDYHYIRLFNYDFSLYNEDIEKQRDTLSKEELHKAYEQYFQNSTFRRLLLE